MADSKPEADIPISLGKPSLRRRLEAYYSLINPDSIHKDPVQWRTDTFPQIYEKYGGTYEGERKLATKLSKKYGASTVRLLLAENNDGISNKNENKQGSKKTDHLEQRDEAWFALRPNEQGSGILDMTSDSFDPMAALDLSRPEQEHRVVQANPWIPSCPVLNFVDQFRPYLPVSDPLHRERRVSKKTGTGAKSSLEETPAKQQRKLGVFAALAEHHKEGPMSLIHRLFEKRQRVRVLIRYVNGIRGTLTGYLVAYDKHYNMILRDVDEVYCPRHAASSATGSGDDHSDNAEGDDRTKENKEEDIAVPSTPSNLEVEMQRRTRALLQTQQRQQQLPNSRQWQVRQRHMKQLMVRGDSVVMVYKAESERSAWPRSSKSPAKSVHGRKAVVAPPDQRVGTPGSLIYALQRQHQQQKRQRPSHGQRRDYRS